MQSRVSAAFVLLALLIATMMVTSPVFAQSRPQVEEIVVNFQVPKLINQDIFVLYDGQTVFLPVGTVFDLLGIYYAADFKNRVFHGDFITPNNPYSLDLRAGKARCHGVELPLPETDYYLTDTELYLRCDRFESIFQLPMTFTFSSLSVYLRPSKNYPAFQKLHRRLAQQRLREEQAEVREIRHLPRTREYLKGAVMDWQLSSSATSQRRVHNFGMSLGAMVMAGDLTLSGNGNSETGIDSDQLSYRWHYHVGDKAEVSQVELGKLFTTGQYSRSITGALVTNKPVVQRKYYQTVQLRDYVGEGWEIELYVNGQLTDFVYTDANGDYNFLVDINYGSSRIELKMFGPNGEIRSEEQFVQVPFNLVPQGVYEYTVAAGQGNSLYDDNWYVQGSNYYGIYANVTAGVSAELVPGASSSDSNSFTADVTYQPLGNLTLNGSYSPNYAMTASANFRELTWLSANGSFTKYFDNPTRNPAGRTYSATMSMSLPVNLGKRYLSLRYHMLMTGFAERTQISQNYGWSTTISGVNLNYLGRWDWRRYYGKNDHSISSRLFATVQAFRWLLPQIQFEYDHSKNEFRRYGVSITKRLFRTGRLAISYERDPIYKSDQVMLTFNLYNAFATFTSRVTRASGDMSFNQSQRGSIMVDQNAGNVLFDRRNSVGLGSAVIRPFLDDNYNGVYDEGEEYLAGLRANIRGAGRRSHGKERLYYYDRLRPYDEYLVEIDEESLDNPLLKPTAKNFSVTVSPNVVTSVEVPLILGGEVSGSVMRPRAIDTVGVGGITVEMLNLTNESLTKVTTYVGGEFYYLGLIPGKYRAYVDPDQLARYNYTATPEFIEFEVDPANDKEFVEGLTFILVPVQAVSPAEAASP